ncbi:MAG: hypothetical protein WC450_12545 [Candidatus Omnitrophota bacterium]|jgi:hypothetical protein
MTPQDLFNYCITEIKKAHAEEQIDKANGETLTLATGKRLAYSDVARRLASMGCVVEKDGE